MKISWVVFCVLFSVLSVSCEKTIRSFQNGTETTCLGIVCPKNFIFEPCTLGDGKNDKCVKCPPDRPISVAKFDSSSFYEPPDNVCKDPHEVCVCADEAKLMNPEECLNNLNPECQCDVSRGYIGSDAKLCKLSENSCSFPGFELALNGSCLKCADEYYKENNGNGECKQQPNCVLPEVVDQPGDSKTERTCKLQPTVNTSFPGKKTSVSNSVPTTDKGYTSIPTSSVTVNVSDASTYSPPGNETINWKLYIVLMIVVVIIGIGLILVMCYRCYSFKSNIRRNEGGNEDSSGFLTKLKNKIYNKGNPRHLNRIELLDIERPISRVKGLQTKSTETDGLLKDTILNISETGNKDDSYVVDCNQLNTIRNSYHDVSQTRQTSESGRSFIGAGNSGMLDISLIGAEQVSNESCQASGSGVKSGKTKNDSSETLLQAIHRQLENHSDTLKNVESVVTKLIPNQIKSESVKSKNASVQTVDNVLDSCEEFNSTGQLSQSPDDIATHENRRNSVDTELKKKISSENTNVKEREQEPTSNVPILHVGSMLSGGNASSSVPSYVYRLCCRSSGEDRLSRGSIECCDGQQHCLKSRVLSEFVTGKVLLSVPFTMAHMTSFIVFVPDNEHDGAKPYIDIQMEQLSKSLEIQSLLESDSIILHLESFETINLQRPEENLEHWVHSISVQPHQMPVPHEQNQADSGIDNNTGNVEVRNEETFNSLSFGSLENDN